jgi:predicted phosphate transport protein (TIGR00153 family)
LAVPFRLTPRDDRFFPMYVEAAQNLVAATSLLPEFLHVTANRTRIAKQLREHEHAGDAVTHRVIHELNSTFVTPFDREDMYRLATTLDDVMDWIEEAADFAVLTEVEALPPEMSQQVDLLCRAAVCTADAMGRLASTTDLPSYWIEVNRLENEADRIHRGLLSRLFSGAYDALTVLKLKQIADNLEEAADAFEHVANAVETIAVKES